MKINKFSAQPPGFAYPGISFHLAASVLIAAVSLIYTGFEFGISNNVYHIPYVLSWDQLPRFHGNDFYQTLKYFTSAVWFLVRLVANEDNVEWVFFAGHVLARMATVYALLYLAWALGLADRVGLVLVALGVVLSPHLLAAYAGGHDLFNSYFTHTAMTWPFVLMALADSQLRRFRRAALFAGIVFLVNAFVGIWLAIALAIGAVFSWVEHGKQDWWQLPAIFLLVCAPVLIWIKLALGSDVVVQAFSFRDYIEAYFGGHFVIDWDDTPRLLEAAAMFVCAIWCSVELGKRGLAWVMGGFVAIFMVGTFLPYLVDHRLIFNLHLLRAAGMVQFVFPLLALVVAWQRWKQEAWIYRASAVLIGVSVINGMSGLGILVGLALPMLSVSPQWRLAWAVGLSAAAAWLGMAIDGAGQLGAGQFVGLYCASGMLLLDKRTEKSGRAFWLMLVLLILVVASVASALALHAGLARYRYVAALALVWGFMLYGKVEWSRAAFLLQNAAVVLAVSLAIQFAGAAVTVVKREMLARQERVAFASYFALIDWLKAQPGRGPLLVPLELKDKVITDEALFRYNLQLFSRQPVWVDWKQGAAVMWQPAFHSVWRPRFEGVKQLETADDFYRYARNNHIRWLMLNDVDDPRKVTCPGTGAPPAFLNGRYRVCILD
ncbi:hypothetical protein [Thiobacillus sp.]